jgi:putative aldouronate transport system permease protein
MNARLFRPSPVFNIINHGLLGLLAVLCIFPIVHVLALSFSTSTAAASGHVTIWPVDFTVMSYRFVTNTPAFGRAFGVSLRRVLLATPINMLLTVLVAYPLAKSKSQFRARNVFVWFFMITVLFSGGLIPWYMIIRLTGLIDKIWALILPSAVPVFNVILMVSFFRNIPPELEEAAYIDGAGHWMLLWKVFLPVSVPVLATVTLFVIVGHWNAWFDGLILMNSPARYPLQSYLQTIIINPDPKMLTERDLAILKVINNRTTKAAQIFIAMVPILVVYPFLQRYFTTGITLGSVKG